MLMLYTIGSRSNSISHDLHSVYLGLYHLMGLIKASGMAINWTVLEMEPGTILVI